MSNNEQLDPAEVKAGDTVTVRFIETGQEFTTKAYQPAGVKGEGWVCILGWPLNKPGGKHGLAFVKFELLDHQPAPEPEPQSGWVSVHIKGRELPNERYTGFITGSGDFHLLEPDTGTHSWAAREEYDSVRPLAVIDPANVDWRGLQSQMSVLVVGAEPFKRAGDILDVVRRALGLLP